jgi:MoaA/NifB/PqqE/SkfB family radical SAM enzyme
LECFKDCTLLRKEKTAHPKNTIFINYNDLKRLKILFGEACNINCVMCWQNHKSKEFLNYDKLIANVDIKPFDSIEIQGGEPLFIESAKRFFDYAALKNKKVSFLTNGTLINQEWAEKIAIHSSFLYFSLNAATKKIHESINFGSKWEVVLKNIKKVGEARERYQTPVKIIGHMTIVIENLGDIPLFIKKYREIGFDSIQFGYDMEVQNYLRKHFKIKESLKLKIKETIRQCEEPSAIDGHRLKLLGFL